MFASSRGSQPPFYLDEWIHPWLRSVACRRCGQRNQAATENGPQDFESRAEAACDCARDFRTTVQAPVVIHGDFTNPQAGLRRTRLHFHVPSEGAIAQVEAGQGIAPNDTEGAKVREIDVPRQSNQARGKPVSETLDGRKRAGFKASEDSRSQNHVPFVLFKALHHAREVIRIVRKVAIHESYGSDLGAEMLNTGKAGLPIPAPGFAYDIGPCSGSYRGRRVTAAVIDNNDLGEEFTRQASDQNADRFDFIQCGDDKCKRVAHTG